MVTTLVAALAVCAAALSSMSTDERLLRGAAFAGLLAVLAMALLLAAISSEPSAADEEELRRLRREVALLRGELAAIAVALQVPAHAPTPVRLPMERQALQIPPQTNGRASSINLDDSVVARH
jgi:hypothetical protein